MKYRIAMRNGGDRVVEADNMTVTDGCLVFYTGSGGDRTTMGVIPVGEFLTCIEDSARS